MMIFFFDLWSAPRHLLIELFYLSSLLQMLNAHRMVHAESFCNFHVVVRAVNFNDGSQLVIVNFQEPATALLIFKALISFAKLLELPLYCTFIRSSWAKCILDVVSCLHCSKAYFELNEENHSDSLFV